MQKVIVIGCPGGGKSTFSRKLSEKTGLPLYHLDLIYHKPDRTTVTREEFDARLGEILERQTWIIDGNYNRTLERRIAAADTVFLLDLPTDVCLEGVKSRIGKPHPDLPWVEESLDGEFCEMIKNFRRDSLPRIYELLRQYERGRDTVIFRSHSEINEYLISENI